MKSKKRILDYGKRGIHGRNRTFIEGSSYVPSICNLEGKRLSQSHLWQMLSFSLDLWHVYVIYFVHLEGTS